MTTNDIHWGGNKSHKYTNINKNNRHTEIEDGMVGGDIPPDGLQYLRDKQMHINTTEATYTHSILGGNRVKTGGKEGQAGGRTGPRGGIEKDEWMNGTRGEI